jgi:site-specific recombinase XerD
LAGISKKVTFHTARHTNATLLLSKGVPIETIRKILGHSSISITAAFYAEVLDSSKRAAVNTLDNIFDNQ